MGAKRKAVIIGAGKMGRGFCAEILASAGCALTFVDSDEDRIRQLNNAGTYSVFKARKTYYETVYIDDYDALSLSDEGAISELIANRGTLVMVSVPMAHLESVAALLSVCIARKAMETPDEPLDILLCINEIEAKHRLHSLFEGMLGGSALDYMENHVGLVETVAYCICPELPDSLSELDALGVLTNGYPEMPMDQKAFKGVPPQSPMIKLTDDLPAEFHRKMYSFNTAYATIGYLACSHHYIWAAEALADPDLASAVREALSEASFGLIGEYGFSPEELSAWNERIYSLIDSPLLGDTISRFCTDTPRKVGPQDRLVGAATLCLRHGGNPDTLCRVIANAYRYTCAEDDRTAQFLRFIESEGIESALERYSRLALRNELHQRIRAIYEKLEDTR